VSLDASTSLELISHGENETEQIGSRLAALLPTAATVVALEGDLGVGKTCFVRGVASCLGIDSRDITSPTFQYLVAHEHGRGLVHADLYRLHDQSPRLREDTADSIGLVEALEGSAVVCVEWWRYYCGPAIQRLVVVEITRHSGDNRQLSFQFHGPELETVGETFAESEATVR